MVGLELLLQNEAALVVLEAIRISGMMIVAPLGFTQAPNRVKAALVLLLTLAAHGQFGRAAVIEQPLEASGVRRRQRVRSWRRDWHGAAADRRVGHEIAGEQIAPMMGLGVAQIFDPMAHGSQNVITSILRNLALLLGVVVGLHRVVIGAVIGSFRVVPAGSVHSTRQPDRSCLLAMSTDALRHRREAGDPPYRGLARDAGGASVRVARRPGHAGVFDRFCRHDQRRRAAVDRQFAGLWLRRRRRNVPRRRTHRSARLCREGAMSHG